MATYNEPSRPYDFVVQDSGSISYDTVTLNSGSGTLDPGSVIGRITKRQAAAPIPTVAGGTGNGTMSLLTFGPDVQVGSYVIQCIEAVAHGGVFSVTAPDGTALPNFTMGTTTGGTARYTSSHLSFSLTDNTDFITANSFTVVVTAGGTPAVVGGTGNGVMSAITLGKLAQLGTYRVINRVAVSNGGDFEVTAPDGSMVGRFYFSASGGTGSFTSDHVNFTVSDDTDYIAGNYFNIIVAGYTAPEAMLWDPTAVNGVQEVFGITTHSAAASTAVTVLTRLAEVSSAALAWKSTVTAAQKADAYRQLADKLIIARS